MIQHFSLERIGKTAAIFNKDKLEWMNGVYLRKLSSEEFARQAMPFLYRQLPPSVKHPLNSDYISQIVPLIQERARTLAEVFQLADFFFLDEPQYATKLFLSGGIDDKSAIQAIETALQRLETVKNWDAASLEGILRPLATELNLSTGKLFGLLRVATTGRTAAPPLFQTMAVLGKEKCLKRLYMALQLLPNY